MSDKVGSKNRDEAYRFGADIIYDWKFSVTDEDGSMGM